MAEEGKKMILSGKEIHSEACNYKKLVINEKRHIAAHEETKKSQKKFQKASKTLLHEKKDSCIIPMLSV